MKRSHVQEPLRRYRVPPPPLELRARVLGACAAGRRPAPPAPRGGAWGRWTWEIALGTAAALLIVACLSAGYRRRGDASPRQDEERSPGETLLAAEGFPPRPPFPKPRAEARGTVSAHQDLERMERSLP